MKSKTVKLKCPKCKKKSFTLTNKEEGKKLWYCYLCKYVKVTGVKKEEDATS